MSTTATPTVVLVHGAFADSASWAPVTQQLLDRGIPVLVPASYNRGLVHDAASIRAFAEHVGGPVLLVGHSYGGAIITVAGVADNVVGLVYVAGYALDEGETLNDLQGRFPASVLAEHLVFTPFPIEGAADGTDVSVDIEQFPTIFAHGVDPATATIFAHSQRPLSAVAFEEKASAAAWKSKPAWGIVSSDDHTINPDVERFGYERAGLKEIVELPAPHLVMHTHPKEIADLIEKALAEIASA